MPIPLLVLAVTALAGTALAAASWKQVEDFFRSEDGQKFLKDIEASWRLQNATNLTMLDSAFALSVAERQAFLRDRKSLIEAMAWRKFVGFVRAVVELKKDEKYLPVWTDVQLIDAEP